MAISAETADCILGNTKPKCPTKSKEVKRWCFTLNNWNDTELNKIINSAVKHSFSYIIGKEVGEQGTPHLQGYINFPKKHSLSAVKKLIECDRVHLEACKGSEKQNADYCMKDGNYITNIKEYQPKKPLKVISELSPWQKEIEQLFFTEPDGRTVHWYWESVGKVGKSQFCRYMYIKHKALVIQGGKLSDIMNIIYNCDIDNLQMILIDIPRKNGNKISYSAVECILNGMITNTKFETGTLVFNPPHVVVLCNYPPDEAELSSDRWNIKEIGK